MQIYDAGQWLEEKHGARSRRNWRKLHLALDADSGEIIVQVMTDQDAGEAVLPIAIAVFVRSPE